MKITYRRIKASKWLRFLTEVLFGALNGSVPLAGYSEPGVPRAPSTAFEKARAAIESEERKQP